MRPGRDPPGRHPKRTRISRPENFEPAALRRSGRTWQAVEQERERLEPGGLVHQPVHPLPHPQGQQA